MSRPPPGTPPAGSLSTCWKRICWLVPPWGSFPAYYFDPDPDPDSSFHFDAYPDPQHSLLVYFFVGSHRPKQGPVGMAPSVSSCLSVVCVTWPGRAGRRLSGPAGRLPVRRLAGSARRSVGSLGKSLPHLLYPSYFEPEEFFANGEQKTPNLPLITVIKTFQF